MHLIKIGGSLTYSVKELLNELKNTDEEIIIIPCQCSSKPL